MFDGSTAWKMPKYVRKENSPDPLTFSAEIATMTDTKSYGNEGKSTDYSDFREGRKG